MEFTVLAAGKKPRQTAQLNKAPLQRAPTPCTHLLSWPREIIAAAVKRTKTGCLHSERYLTRTRCVCLIPFDMKEFQFRPFTIIQINIFCLLFSLQRNFIFSFITGGLCALMEKLPLIAANTDVIETNLYGQF